MPAGLAAAAFRTVLAWQIGRTLFRLGFAGALAVLAGTMIEEGALDPAALVAAMAGLVLATVAGYGAERATAEAEAQLVSGIRASIETRLSELPTASLRHRSAGDLIVGLARYPDHLGRLVISHAIAARMLSVGPLMAAAAVLPVSWEAALTLLLATPVMIVFFVLAGSLIHARAEAQEKALGPPCRAVRRPHPRAADDHRQPRRRQGAPEAGSSACAPIPIRPWAS